MYRSRITLFRSISSSAESFWPDDVSMRSRTNVKRKYRFSGVGGSENGLIENPAISLPT